jgi:hypothetical protein
MRPDFNFERLIETFNKLTANLNVDIDKLAGDVIRDVSATGKEVLDSAMQGYSKDVIQETVKDLYAQVTGQDAAEALVARVHAIDAEQIKAVVDKVATDLQKPEVAADFAGQLKNLLDQASNEEIGMSIESLLDRSLNAKLMFQMVFATQISPVLDQIRASTKEEAADMIAMMASNLPTDIIAVQLASLGSIVTPEMITSQTQQLTDRLPAPATVADAVHNVAASASAHLDRISKSATLSEAVTIAKEFAAGVNAVVTDTLANPSAQQEPPAAEKPVRKRAPRKPKKGGGTDLS